MTESAASVNAVGCIRFLFMTGVSKFTKLSVFSAPSNIRDMTWAASLGVKLLAADWPRFFIGLSFDPESRKLVECAAVPQKRT